METNLSRPPPSSIIFDEVVSKETDILREEQTGSLDDSLSQESIHSEFDYFDQRDEVPDIDGPFCRNRATSSVHLPQACVPVSPNVVVRAICTTVSDNFENDAAETHVTVAETSERTPDFTSSGQEVLVDSTMSRSLSSDSLSSTSSSDVLRVVPDFERASPRNFLRQDWVVPDVSLFDSDSSDEERSMRAHMFDMDHVVPTGFAEE